MDADDDEAFLYGGGDETATAAPAGNEGESSSSVPRPSRANSHPVRRANPWEWVRVSWNNERNGKAN